MYSICINSMDFIRAMPDIYYCRNDHHVTPTCDYYFSLDFGAYGATTKTYIGADGAPLTLYTTLWRKQCLNTIIY